MIGGASEMHRWCRPTVLRGVQLSALEPSRPDTSNDVLIGEDGTVAALGHDVVVAPGTDEVDARDLVVFPGLIDCHVHLCFHPGRHPQDLLCEISEPELDELVRVNARASLARGVTTVRDLGSRGDAVRRLKAAIARGDERGPRVQCSGPALTSAGGHCWFAGEEVGGPAAIAASAATRAAQGDEWLKLMVTGGTLTRGSDPGTLQLSDAAIAAGVDHAVRAGMRTAAHALSERGTAVAVAAGVDTIEHGVGLSSRDAASMRRAGQSLVPTLAASALALEANPLAASEDMVQVRALQDDHRRGVSRALDAGVTFLAGSDAGCPDVPHGSAAEEVRLLVAAGLDRRAALLAATSEAARALGLPGVGHVAVGCCADLLLLDADPFEDLSALQRPVAVYARGRREHP